MNEILNHPFLHSVPSKGSTSSAPSAPMNTVARRRTYHKPNLESSSANYDEVKGGILSRQSSLTFSAPSLHTSFSPPTTAPLTNKGVFNLNTLATSSTLTTSSLSSAPSYANWLSVVKNIKAQLKPQSHDRSALPTHLKSRDNVFQKTSSSNVASEPFSPCSSFAADSSLNAGSDEGALLRSSTASRAKALLSAYNTRQNAQTIKLIQHSDLIPFCYLSPKLEEIILVTAEKSILLVSSFHNAKTQRKEVYRVLLLARSPQQLALGRVDNAMSKELDLITNAVGLKSIPKQISGKRGSDDDDDKNRIYCEDKNSSFLSLEDFSSLAVHLQSNDAASFCKFYSIYRLPKALRSLYLKTALIIGEIRSKIPKLVLYLTVNDVQKGQAAVNTGGKIACKCMLMSNTPLPDFCVQWADGTKLRYCLENGRLRLQGPSIAVYHWTDNGVKDGSSVLGWAELATEEQSKYLLVAQRAMKRCLAQASSGMASANITSESSEAACRKSFFTSAFKR